MDLKGLAGGQYKPLSEKDIQTIHEASIGILEKTGFTYESGLDDTLRMLEAAGAQVDRAAARIRFPRNVVLEHIRKAPRKVVLYSRTGKDDLDLTEDRVYLGTGGAAIRIIDLETRRVSRHHVEGSLPSRTPGGQARPHPFLPAALYPHRHPRRRLRREHVLRLPEGNRQARHVRGE